MTENALNPLNLLGGAGAIREIGRTIIDGVLKSVKDVTVKGATVRASVPGAATVVVHIDGDPPAEARSINLATQEFFEVGRRVYVILWPPSGALVLGGIGAATPWIPYPSDAPDPAFYSAQNFAPTITEAVGSLNYSQFPATSATSSWTSVSLPAQSVVVFCLGSRLAGLPKRPSSWSVTGTPLDWQEVDELCGKASYFAGGELFLYAGMWWAYNDSAQTVDFTVTWDDTTTGAKVYANVLCASNVLRVQTPNQASDYDTIYDCDAAVVGSLTGTHTVNVTTQINYAQVVGFVVGADYDALGAPNFGWSAASGCSIVAEEQAAYDDGYSGFCTVKRSSGVVTPGSTAIGATQTTLDGNNEFGLIMGLEIQGKPNVPVAGNGTFFSSYHLLGKELTQRLDIVAGSTTTFGGGPLGLHLPPGMTACSRPTGGSQSIPGTMVVGTNRYRVAAVIAAGAAYFDKILYQDAATQYLDATHPATLASTFRLNLKGAIEID